jgi:hypothetical protein
MSLSLYGVPDGQKKGQSDWPCPSVYSPTTALGSLSSVALSSAPAPLTLAQPSRASGKQRKLFTLISSGFLSEATNHIWRGFLREATGLRKYLSLNHFYEVSVDADLGLA